MRLERAFYGKQISKPQSPVESPKLEEEVLVSPGPMPEEYVDDADPVDSGSVRDKHISESRNVQRGTSPCEDSSEDDIDGIPVDTHY